MKRLTRFYRHIYRELLRPETLRRWYTYFTLIANVALVFYILTGAFLPEYKEAARLLTLAFYTLGLLVRVPTAQRQERFRLPLLYAAIGLSMLGMVVNNPVIFIGVTVLMIAIMLLPPNDPPEDKRPHSKVN